MTEVEVKHVVRSYLEVEYDDLGELSYDLVARRADGWSPVGSSWMHGNKRRMQYVRERNIPCIDDVRSVL